MLAARLATAAALIAGLIGALLFIPQGWLGPLFAVLAGLAGVEWARLCGFRAGTSGLYGTAIAMASLVCVALGWERPACVVALAFWLLAVPVWLLRGVAKGHAYLLSCAGFVVLVPAALATSVLDARVLFLTLALVWIADSAAYFVGRAWGRHKLAPAISPGKTWEGAAGGLLGALLYAMICGAFVEEVRWPAFLGAVALVTALSIMGDLFESAAKRQAGVKDSGALLPGHGGILDRIDSATAALPVAALLWPLVNGR